MGYEIYWVNLKYINDVNTAALETEILVFKRAFQEKASLFDDILEVSKEAPPQIPETLLLFPNAMTITDLILINPATTATLEKKISVARKPD